MGDQRCAARRALVAWTMAAVVVGSLRPCLADGVFLPSVEKFRRDAERALREPEQKAVILYQDGTEDLIISPRFSADVRQFAWLVPVPAVPKVEKLDGALFHEIHMFRYQWLRHMYESHHGKGLERRLGARPLVSVLERKYVGAYDAAVLQIRDEHALVSWLRRHRFAVPQGARTLAALYVREGWTFVAARVAVPRYTTGLAGGLLAPLRLRFRTTTVVYPLRMSALNPTPFLVDLYVIVPGLRGQNRGGNVVHPLDRRPMPLGFLADGTPDAHSTPTLQRLVKGPCSVFEFRAEFAPERCRRDLVVNLPKHPRDTASDVRRTQHRPRGGGSS